MTFAQWLAFTLACLAAAALLFVWLPRWRLGRALARPFPTAWESGLRSLPWYAGMPAALREELQQQVKAFLHAKRFVGCEGLEVTDEMRVIVAAQACTLLLNRPNNGFPGLRWIYLFPTEFRNRQPEEGPDGLVSRPSGTLLGVSWSNGRVVLAWDSVLEGLADASDGHNVVLHEFAHQLDQEGGHTDGAPLLYTRAGYRNWSRVLGREYRRLQARQARGLPGLIDPYGATAPAEFFAVITELFYERPAAMAHAYPELFATLQDYYRVDPRQWREDASGPHLGSATHGWPGNCKRESAAVAGLGE